MSDRKRPAASTAKKKTAKPATKAKPAPAPKKSPKAKAATPQPEVTTPETVTIEQPAATPEPESIEQPTATEQPTTAIDTTPEPTPTIATRPEQPTTPTTPRKLSALDAAAQVLASAPEPMNTKDLVQAMASLGLWTSPGGKTPHATLYSAILREITTKGIASRFRKTARGRFAHTSN